MRKMNFLITLNFLIVLTVVETRTVDPNTNVTEKIASFFKTNLSQHFGLCDKISDIEEIYGNKYVLTTLEIEKDNFKTHQICDVTFHFDEKLNVMTLTRVNCEGTKNVPVEEYLRNWVTNNYNTSCFVDKIGVYNENNIWMKAFGENDGVRKAENVWWSMDMYVFEPLSGENIRDYDSLIHKSRTTNECKMEFSNVMKYDRLFNKDLNFKRTFCDKTNVWLTRYLQCREELYHAGS